MAELQKLRRQILEKLSELRLTLPSQVAPDATEQKPTEPNSTQPATKYSKKFVPEDDFKDSKLPENMEDFKKLLSDKNAQVARLEAEVKDLEAENQTLKEIVERQQKTNKDFFRRNWHIPPVGPHDQRKGPYYMI